jgi:23S rRNA G2445 N2-methylase RlmL
MNDPLLLFRSLNSTFTTDVSFEATVRTDPDIGDLVYSYHASSKKKNKAGRARAVHLLGTESRYHLFILERTFLLMLDPVGRSLSQQISRPSPAYRCHQKDTILKREIS